MVNNRLLTALLCMIILSSLFTGCTLINGTGDSVPGKQYDNGLSTVEVDTSGTFVQENDTWYYKIDDKVAEKTTGLVPGTVNGIASSWKVVDGIVSFTDGFAANEEAVYYVKAGQLDTSFTGFVSEDRSNFYYVEDGVVSDQTALIKGTVDGNKSWWKVVNGKVSFTSGFASNDNGVYYVTNGMLDVSYNGFGEDEDGGWYYVKNGKVRTDVTSLVKGSINGTYTWWNVVTGKVSFTTGLAANNHGQYYVKDGQIDYSYTGSYVENGVKYEIVEGKVIE